MAKAETYYKSAQLRTYKGSWRGQLKYKDSDGNWRNISKVLDAKGKREAQKELEAWHAEMEREAQFELKGYSKARTVGAFVAQYIDTLEHSETITTSTAYGYRKHLKYINAQFSKTLIGEIDPDTVQAWLNGMLNDGYSTSTVKKTFNLLHAAYKDAVARRAIPYNPLGAVKAPKTKQQEPNALDREGMQRLVSYLDIAAETPTTLAIRLALVTGMREGEICGLRWRDVDLKAQIVRVRTVIGQTNTTYVKEPKTRGSRRDIPIDEQTAALLKNRRMAMAEQCMEAGVPMAPELYVFGNIDGSYLKPNRLWRDWKAISSSLGLVGTEGKAPTFHDLRHTFATAAIASGADVKSVSSIMGHANAAMTLNIYASADAEAKRRTMESVSKVITEAPKEAEILALGKTGTEN